MPKPLLQPGISPRGWASLIGISVLFWPSVFYFCPHPGRLVNFLIAYVLLIFVRCLIKPVPAKQDPLSKL